MIGQLLSVDHNGLTVKQDECDPDPLVGGVAPKVVGTTLDACVTGPERSLFARIEFELDLTKDDDTVVKRLGAVHGTACLRRQVDKSYHGTVVVVRTAGEDGLDSTIFRRLVVDGPLISAPHDLKAPTQSGQRFHCQLSKNMRIFIESVS